MEIVVSVVFAIHLIKGAYVGNRFNSSVRSPPNKWGNPLSFLRDDWQLCYVLRCRSKRHPSYLFQSIWRRRSSRIGSCSARPSFHSCGGTGSASQTIHQCRYSGHTSRSHGLGETHSAHASARTHNHFLSLPKKTTIYICQNKATGWLIQANIIGSNRQGFVYWLANGVAVYGSYHLWTPWDEPF